jgi:hypothetical protein
VFRQCVDGEILVDNQCLVCPSGSFSFHYDPLHPATLCRECPPFTDGCYGTTILASPGYWRINKYSLVMMECPYGKAACHGGGISIPLTAKYLPTVLQYNNSVSPVASENSNTNSAPTAPTNTIGDSPEGCAMGYEGPLCATCSVSYYFSASSESCNSCDGQGIQQLAIMIAIPLLLLSLVAYVTFSTFLMRDVNNNDFALDLLGTRAMNMESTSNDLGMAQTLYKAAYEHQKEAEARREEGQPPAKYRMMVERIAQHMTHLVVVMTPKVKIMLTVYQIVSSFPYSLNIEFTTISAKLFHAFRY